MALSIDSRRPGVTWHPVLRSPDFPLSINDSDYLADFPDAKLLKMEAYYHYNYLHFQSWEIKGVRVLEIYASHHVEGFGFQVL